MPVNPVPGGSAVRVSRLVCAVVSVRVAPGSTELGYPGRTPGCWVARLGMPAAGAGVGVDCGIKAPLPGSTTFSTEFSCFKIAFATFTAVVGSGPAGTGAAAVGSSARKGCCGAAAALPAPQVSAAQAVNANPMPRVAAASGPCDFRLPNIFTAKGMLLNLAEALSALQTLKSPP